MGQKFQISSTSPVKPSYFNGDFQNKTSIPVNAANTNKTPSKYDNKMPEIKSNYKKSPPFISSTPTDFQIAAHSPCITSNEKLTLTSPKNVFKLNTGKCSQSITKDFNEIKNKINTNVSNHTVYKQQIQKKLHLSKNSNNNYKFLSAKLYTLNDDIDQPVILGENEMNNGKNYKIDNEYRLS